MQIPLVPGFATAIPVGDPGNPWMPDSPELGIWSDGLYIAADMYDCAGSATTCGTATYSGTRAWALNTSKMYIAEALLPEDIQRTTLGTGYQGPPPRPSPRPGAPGRHRELLRLQGSAHR